MKHITTLALFALALTAKAQVAEIVASGGGQLSTSAMSIDFTIGDIATSAHDNNSVILFEGFQAANYGGTLITGLPVETTFAFYPNPTQRYLHIEAEFATGSSFHVTDMSGKHIDLPAELTKQKAIVDVSSLPASLYILTIQDKSGNSYHMKFIKAL